MFYYFYWTSLFSFSFTLSINRYAHCYTILTSENTSLSLSLVAVVFFLCHKCMHNGTWSKFNDLQGRIYALSERHKSAWNASNALTLSALNTQRLNTQVPDCFVLCGWKMCVERIKCSAQRFWTAVNVRHIYLLHIDLNALLKCVVII